MGARCKTARKEHRCDECGRLIPLGHKYWARWKESPPVDHREHTNCLAYRDAELLHPHFNKDRSRRKP